MEVCWIDTANQIHNSWYKDTAVGIFMENSGKFYGVIISGKFKLKIKDKLSIFDSSAVVGHLQAYLVYLCCSLIEPLPEIERTYLCSDFQPINAYHKYLQKCFSYHGKTDLFLKMRLVKKPKEVKSKAHPKVRKLYKRRKEPSLVFDAEHLEQFLEYFNRQSLKKKERKG